MGIFNKIKNVLFTEEEETTEIPLIQKEEDKQEDNIRRFNDLNFDEKKEEKSEIKQETKEVVEEEKKEERSPFQSFDEEEFDRIAAINKNKLLERDRRLREEKERTQRYSAPQRIEIPKEEVKVEVKRFKPTPVISPVYGILDKNYTKDDILPTASSEGTLPKIMDVDAVRQKAFGTLESMEQSIKEDNLDNIKITSFDSEDGIVVPDVIEDEKADDEEITSPLPKLEDIVDEIEKEETKEVVEDKDNDKIESDLFDLIDSMYKEEGE